VRIISIIRNWEQAVTWLVLLVVLYSIVSGKLRYDLTAFGGLLFLGILGLIKPGQLFSGFSSPALFTIATVLVMSAGIVESGLLSGFGKKIAGRIHKYKNQIFALFLTTGFISAFMNNVGAIGIVLPTAKRMAQRAKVPPSAFGIPIAYASILGGSLTLIGTASNLIVSTYRTGAFGEPFKMFDFSLHGLTMLLSGVIVLFLCRVCGLRPIEKVITNNELIEEEIKNSTEDTIPRSRRKSLIVLITLVPIVVLTGIGLVHPSIAFGIVTLIWIISGVLAYKTALAHINIPIIIFLGSMFGISTVLEETGALGAAVSLIGPLLTLLPPFLLILIFLFVTALFANILDNSVAAVLMAPVAVALWRAGAVPFNPDALLMAVAAGASLGIVIPTHQATIVVMNSMDFSRKSFIKTGAAIAAIAGSSSAFVIYTIWC
jgi:di/tricarboxylate transporter